MIDVIEISEENLDDFMPLLGEDISDDVRRVYYHAFGVLDDDDEALGAFVYEILNSESEEDTRSRISFAKSDDTTTLEEMVQYYKENSVKEGEILESFCELDDEVSAKAFAKDGFSFKKRESENITISLKDLEATVLAKKAKIPDYVGSIESLTVLQFRDAVKQILFKGHKGILEDVAFLPKNWFDNSISAYVTSGGMICGLFLVRKSPSGMLVPVLYFAYGPESRMHLLHMLRFTAQKALELYPGNTKVMILRRSDAIKALAGKLLPGKSGEEIFFGTRKEV